MKLMRRKVWKTNYATS